MLLGAPTGSGKTISAELAMLRVFNHYPGQKIIYIAPLKVGTGLMHRAGGNEKKQEKSAPSGIRTGASVPRSSLRSSPAMQ